MGKAITSILPQLLPFARLISHLAAWHAASLTLLSWNEHAFSVIEALLFENLCDYSRPKEPTDTKI